MKKKISILIFVCCFYSVVKAQDTFLSQLSSNAQFLSPASVGNGVYQSRVQSNYRSQLLDGNTLYKTIFLGWDRRYKNKDENVQNYLGLGGQLISDQVMNGILQTNYLTMNAAYHIFFDDDLRKNFALGLGLTFAQSNLKVDELKFLDQFSNGEFLLNTSSASLANLINNTSKFSMNTGLLYTSHTQTSFVQFSANAFFMSKPELTIDNTSASSGFKTLLFFNIEKEGDDKKTFMIHASLNSRNANAQYLIGGAIGLPFGSYYEFENRLYLGLYGRINNGQKDKMALDAIIPNFSILMSQYRFGLSYDIYSSGFSGAQIKPSSFELSFSKSFGKRRADYFRTIFD